jgi:light-regulated signal transduction histidine kinase (bacteriophytochrome)
MRKALANRGLMAFLAVVTGLLIGNAWLGYQQMRHWSKCRSTFYFNAIAAMPHGGQLTVQTKVATPVDGPVTSVIVVKDTGIGIDPGDRPKIFEPFFTAKKRTGLGLGLSVCERIVGNYGGRIEVEDQLGEGTQVTIFLPLEPDTKVRADSVFPPAV